MGRLMQVRDVPENVHRKLKARAAEQGMSLSEYLRGELALIAARPTMDELLERLHKRKPVDLPKGWSAQVIRELRGPLP